MMRRRSPESAMRASAALLLAALFALAGCDRRAAAPAEAEHVEAEGHAGEEGTLVRLDSAALAMADVEVGAAEAVATSGLTVTGTITYDAARVSHVGPRAEGRIMGLRAELGSRVRAGQTLAVLESSDIGAIRTELHESAALVEIARENHERERRLEEQGISSRRELLDARAELRRAEAGYQSARERLRILGAGSGQGGQFAVTAPFGGVVVEKHASLGEVAGPTDQLFTLADLSRLWIELDVFERDLARVAEGQPARVTTAAYPDRVFPGRIVYVGDILDPERRTVRARVEVPNESGLLKPGMFARAEIETGTGSGAPVTVVPRGAVQEVDGRAVVWMPGDAPGEFRIRPVEVGASAGGARVMILSGLQPGERVVIRGAFTLKAELSRGEFGGHAH
jgi:cobalt-zinc-cadmium efflux system membrane fusion protein